jgi:putative endonuclease
MPRMYYVYILASRRHGTLYIGVTNSLRKRLEEHLNGRGSSFVRTYCVCRLVYVESYDRVEGGNHPREAAKTLEA